jgi:hypothetical protein
MGNTDKKYEDSLSKKKLVGKLTSNMSVDGRIFFTQRRSDPTRVMASSFLRFLDHTQRHITGGRTPLDE